ncbi:NAD(P)-dependent oxidoreductase [uncultured Helcococcus sp.]|uniref:NAD(P)-dependent oxidoreductase n=1 Tax=uncultured Helcococcus sp. TaxID=1072508 RepID=UPI002637B90E|nr:NAD(P)-dependent oxidoreductase [uncultured Helcococcus sp.]
MKITILEPLAVEEDQLKNIFKKLTDSGHKLEIYDTIAKDENEQIERMKDTDILVIANSPLGARAIKSAKNLKMIAVAFTGFDHVDMEACKERNILVSNASGYANTAVAELAVGMALDLYRNIISMDEKTRELKTKVGYRFRELKGKKVGIIGTGAIGCETAKLFHAFGCEILAYSNSEKKEILNLGGKYLSLEDLLKQSDIVSLHLPYNESTERLIGEKEFKLMKNDAIFINCARGQIVDNEALKNALNNDLIGGAGIDVFDKEPPLNEDESLLKAKNILLSPHIGYFTEEAMIKRAKITLENIEGFINNKPINVVS